MAGCRGSSFAKIQVFEGDCKDRILRLRVCAETDGKDSVWTSSGNCDHFHHDNDDFWVSFQQDIPVPIAKPNVP